MMLLCCHSITSGLANISKFTSCAHARYARAHGRPAIAMSELEKGWFCESISGPRRRHGCARPGVDPEAEGKLPTD